MPVQAVFIIEEKHADLTEAVWLCFLMVSPGGPILKEIVAGRTSFHVGAPCKWGPLPSDKRRIFPTFDSPFLKQRPVPVYILLLAVCVGMEKVKQASDERARTKSLYRASNVCLFVPSAT